MELFPYYFLDSMYTCQMNIICEKEFAFRFSLNIEHFRYLFESNLHFSYESNV